MVISRNGPKDRGNDMFTRRMSILLLKHLSCENFNQFTKNTNLQKDIYGAAFSGQELKLLSNACCLNLFIYCASSF